MKIFNLVAEHKADLLNIFPWIALFVAILGLRIFLDKATPPFKQIHMRILGGIIILSSGFFLIRELATWGVFFVFCLYTSAYIMTMKKKEKKPSVEKDASHQSTVQHATNEELRAHAKPIQSSAYQSSARKGFLAFFATGSLVILAGMSTGYAPSISMGPSMWPAAPKSASMNLLNTSAFTSEAPVYGEDIEFEVPKGASWPQGRYRKRVWGIPGDYILVEEYGVVINGKRFADCNEKSKIIVHNYPRVWWCQVIFPNKKAPRSFVWGDINPMMYKSFREIVKTKQLFVMGDNTVESSDSREFGPIQQSWVVGRYDNAATTKEKWKSW